MSRPFSVQQIDHGQAFSGYFNDPYGNRYEITSYDADLLRESLS